MEYPFGHVLLARQKAAASVLILLLVEYPFGQRNVQYFPRNNEGLNPSFSGISFRTAGGRLDRQWFV